MFLPFSLLFYYTLFQLLGKISLKNPYFKSKIVEENEMMNKFEFSFG